MVSVVPFRPVCLHAIQPPVDQLQEGHVGWGLHCRSRNCFLYRRRVFQLLLSFCCGLFGLVFRFEPGSGVPGSLQDEVVPPSLSIREAISKMAEAIRDWHYWVERAYQYA